MDVFVCAADNAIVTESRGGPATRWVGMAFALVATVGFYALIGPWALLVMVFAVPALSSWSRRRIWTCPTCGVSYSDVALSRAVDRREIVIRAVEPVPVPAYDPAETHPSRS